MSDTILRGKKLLFLFNNNNIFELKDFKNTLFHKSFFLMQKKKKKPLGIDDVFSEKELIMNTKSNTYFMIYFFNIEMMIY
jgi:hypothetical protein